MTVSTTVDTMIINEGLDLILSHFQHQQLWPRNISTTTTENKQVLVSSKEEAYARFAQANFLDCRISAYPPNAMENPSATERFLGIRTRTPRNLMVMIDLDRCNFKTERSFRMAYSRVLWNIKKILGTNPAVLWSGNGYHIYLVLDCPINLENVKQLIELKIDRPSLRFLRFIESYLSYDLSDKAHNSTVSFGNCMIRIPGSINSDGNSEVKLIQQWDCMTPAANILLADFVGYVVDEKMRGLRESRIKAKSMRPINSSFIDANNPTTTGPYTIDWVERLLQTSMDDHRKFAVWMILPQYLVNCRKLSYDNAYNIVVQWLEQCTKLKRLDRSTKQKLNSGFEAADRGYRPISKEKMRVWKPELYSLLFNS